MSVGPRETVRYGFLLLLGGALSLAAAELLLQVLELRAVTHRLRPRDPATELFEVDPFLQIRPRHNPTEGINEHSLRGEPLDRSPEVLRVFVHGGSTSFGARLLFEETYPARLEKELRARRGDVPLQVQNAASDWYSTEHSIVRYLFLVRHLDPDIVIVNHGVNDLMRSFAPEWWSAPGATFREDYSHYLGPIVNLDPAHARQACYVPFSSLLLPRALRRYVTGDLVPGEIHPQNPRFLTETFEATREVSVSRFPSLDVFERNLRLFVDLVRRDGHRIVLVTQPNVLHAGIRYADLPEMYFAPVHCAERGARIDLESLRLGLAKFNAAVRRVGQELACPVVDLESRVPKTSRYFFDAVHPRPAATEIEAAVLADALIELGWVGE